MRPDRFLADLYARFPALLTHLLGWILAACMAFGSAPGRTAADTKLDLALNPGGFLLQALRPWTDVFPLGQLQNQAYGYLFPQGAFFLLTDPLPDWVAQRLWWTLIIGLGFSGFLRLAHTLRLPSPALGAAAYALSPRILTTIGAISSEAWPVVLVPWLVEPLVRAKPALGRSIIAVACLGAVNATATIAACVPAGFVLLYRRRWVDLGHFVIGSILVSMWWLIPLATLGRLSPPFTDFIENAHITTGNLNGIQVLRGTTSWTPFVDGERIAGHALATHPVLILATVAVAAAGLVGLARTRHQGMWITLLLVGVVVLCGSHYVTGFLDGPGALLRNVHKFDPLVRLPLCIGLACINVHWQRLLFIAATLAVVMATSPAWSARLAPKGTFEEVPGYVYEAADWINEHGAHTRTLIYPPMRFARQDWGWTRDEPLQPLLTVPWIARDAVPLIDPEAIRGLDGVMDSLKHGSFDSLPQLGVGLIAVRHDVGKHSSTELIEAAREEGFRIHSFGEMDVVEIDTARGPEVVDQRVDQVLGGGESIALLNEILGYQPRQITSERESAQIITDTPLAIAQDYGSGAHSGLLARREEASDVKNPVIDYPSSAPRLWITETGGTVTAGPNAADATSVYGSQTNHSPTAAVDGFPGTAFYGDWLRLDPEGDKDKRHRLLLQVSGRDGDVLVNGTPVFVRVGEVAEIDVDKLPVTIIPSPNQGIAEADMGIRREIVVHGSASAHHYLFSQRQVYTGVLARTLVLDEPARLDVNASSCAAWTNTRIDGRLTGCEPIDLSAGEHHITTNADWIMLTNPDAPPAPHKTLVDTKFSYNSGLSMGDAPPTTINAGIQAFEADEYSALRFPRSYLLVGVIISLVVVAWALYQPSTPRTPVGGSPTPRIMLAAPLILGLPGLAGIAVAWAVRRFTTLRIIGPAMLVAGVWLQRGMGAGGHPLTQAAVATVLALVVLSTCKTGTRWERSERTSPR